MKATPADKAEIRDGATPLDSALIEAANRAEVATLFHPLRHRVYRSEADIDGEDLVVRTPAGEFRPVQLKGGPAVKWKRYDGRGLWMLFPSAPWRADATRAWFVVPHDDLFAWFKGRHGHTAVWQAEAQWNTGKPPKALLEWMPPHRIAPAARHPCSTSLSSGKVQ